MAYFCADLPFKNLLSLSLTLSLRQQVYTKLNYYLLLSWKHYKVVYLSLSYLILYNQKVNQPLEFVSKILTQTA